MDESAEIRLNAESVEVVAADHIRPDDRGISTAAVESYATVNVIGNQRVEAAVPVTQIEVIGIRLRRCRLRAVVRSTMYRLPGFGTLSGCRTSADNTLKTMALAPMASARVSTAVTANPGALRSCRKASRSVAFMCPSFQFRGAGCGFCSIRVCWIRVCRIKVCRIRACTGRVCSRLQHLYASAGSAVPFDRAERPFVHHALDCVEFQVRFFPGSRCRLPLRRARAGRNERPPFPER